MIKLSHGASRGSDYVFLIPQKTIMKLQSLAESLSHALKAQSTKM